MRKVSSYLLPVVFLCVALPAWGQAEAAEEAGEEQEVTLETRCTTFSETLGRMPRPGCKAAVFSNADRKLITYEYNKIGLRDKDYPAEKAKGEIRIVLMGSAVDNAFLELKDGPAAALQKELRRLSGRPVVVINGSVPRFSVIRNAEFARTLAEAYKPDLFVYYQSGEDFSADAMERTNAEFGPNHRLVGFENRGQPLSPPPFMDWIWPGPGIQRRWIYTYEQIVSLWRIRSPFSDRRHFGNLFLTPSVNAFRKIKRLGAETPGLVIFYDGKPSDLKQGRRALSRVTRRLLLALYPNVFIKPDRIEKEFSEKKLSMVRLPAEFSQRKGKLAHENKPTSLSAEGARRFAEAAAPEILKTSLFESAP